MSADIGKSLANDGPFDGRAGSTTAIVADDFGVRKYDATTSSQAHTVPAHWNGREVLITASGGVVHYGWSTLSSAVINSAAAATAAGTVSQVGMPIPDSLAAITRSRIPYANGQPIYFVRDATATADVYMQLVE